MNTNKTAKQIFNEALDLIRDPKRWTQGYFARNSIGDEVGSYDEYACRWCSSGAVQKVGGLRGDVFIQAAIIETLNKATERDWRSIADFNDQNTHAEVIALWEKVGREQGWME